MMKNKCIGLLASLFIASGANAGELSPLIGAGYGFGGDTLGSLLYVNGNVSHVKANQGFSIYGGLEYLFDNKFGVRGTVGYKFDISSAANAEMTFSRIPVELIALKDISGHRFGGGLTYQTNVEYVIEIGGDEATFDFEGATGLVAFYELAFPSDTGAQGVFGVRYTSIEYESSIAPLKRDGSGVDLYLAWHF